MAVAKTMEVPKPLHTLNISYRVHPEVFFKYGDQYNMLTMFKSMQAYTSDRIKDAMDDDMSFEGTLSIPHVQAFLAAVDDMEAEKAEVMCPKAEASNDQLETEIHLRIDSGPVEKAAAHALALYKCADYLYPRYKLFPFREDSEEFMYIRAWMWSRPIMLPLCMDTTTRQEAMGILSPHFVIN